MMHIRNLSAVAVAVGILCAQQPGQQQPGQKQPGQQQADTADSPDVKFGVTAQFIIAPAIVTDQDGKVVNGLLPIDFRLYDNKKLQKITEDVATHPISLVVAVQASSAAEKLLPGIQKIGSLFDGLVLGDAGEIAILSFDHRIQHLTDFTSEPGKAAEALKKLKAGSSSARLNDATNEAINMLRRRPTTRKRILLLISESRDQGSEFHVRDVLTSGEFANVKIFSVDMSHLLTSLTAKTEPPRPNAIPPEARHLPAGIVGTPTTDSQMNTGNFTPVFKELFIATKAIFVSNPLEVFTKFTGGREYSYSTQRSLEQAIADIGEELHSEYLLTYSPNNLMEGGYHEIVVEVMRPGLKVRTRPGYWLAAKPE